ncbi:phage tail protein [Sorangium sp. So ce388]|uniref:phage tail protein n=1 Tax=Sorangium sp. So ce388 TaxID=3133309 RepID=UPI003F5C6AD4
MDANRLRFWMLADERDWTPVTPDDIRHDPRRRALVLSSRRDLPPVVEHEAEASARLARVPGAIDAFGTWARWDETARKVMATGAVPGEAPIFTPAAGEAPTDLAIGHDGALYIALGGRVVIQDLRGRWDPVTLSDPALAAWRLAADPSGGVWALGGPPGAPGAPTKLARVRGLPLPRRFGAGPGPETFRLRDDNPAPPRITGVTELALPGERPVAIAVSPAGRVGVLTWRDGGDARLRVLDGAAVGVPMDLAGARFPYGFAWLSEGCVAVLLTSFPAEAIAYPFEPGDASAPPAGDLYPLTDHDGGPLMHGTTSPPHYLSARGPSPLHPISLPSLSSRGIASNAKRLDSGSARTVWHRLYLEGLIPPGTGVRVLLAATDDPAPPSASDVWAWNEHRFGAVPRGPDEGEVRDVPKDVDIPRGVWVPQASEIPFHEGLRGCRPVPHESGLFTALIQRPTRRVRALRGRYLWARVELLGDGRSGPELAALRAYASRFSYVERYLPEIFRESLFGEDADAHGKATPADFLERLIDDCEGVLTPIEDRIAAAWMLTDARTVPEASLEWLASWIGFAFDPVVPAARRRALLEAAPDLYRWRGTLRGLTRALDVVTGGAVSEGRVVVVEDFRLRRTFATILGADLGDRDDPLLPGLTASGSSFVGDTLFLGEEMKKEFLAVFVKDLLDAPATVTGPGADAQAALDAEREAVRRFFLRLAHRVTILVHQEVEREDPGLIRRVAELEAPAHVSTVVTTASHPFIVGVASLIGVDTYLARKAPPRTATIGGSYIGVRDLVERPPTLDPRTEGGSG